MTAWPFGNLVPQRYRVILADPAWLYRLWGAAGEAKAPAPAELAGGAA